MAIENPSNAPWLVEARQFVGLKEIVGSRHEAKILQFFAEAGHPGIHDDETAWCAAFVGAMLRRAGYGSSGALNARSYLNFGTKLDKPTPGCIVVFKRGTSAWQGHVGFVVRILANGSLIVRGGNQGNAVSDAQFGTADVLGYRWPLVKSAPAAAKPKPPTVKDIAKTAARDAGIGGAATGAGRAGETATTDPTLPWGEILVAMVLIAAVVFAVSFAWRWWKARQAAQEPVAENVVEAPPVAVLEAATAPPVKPVDRRKPSPKRHARPNKRAKAKKRSA